MLIGDWKYALHCQRCRRAVYTFKEAESAGEVLTLLVQHYTRNHYWSPSPLQMTTETPEHPPLPTFAQRRYNDTSKQRTVLLFHDEQHVLLATGKLKKVCYFCEQTKPLSWTAVRFDVETRCHLNGWACNTHCAEGAGGDLSLALPIIDQPDIHAGRFDTNFYPCRVCGALHGASSVYCFTALKAGEKRDGKTGQYLCRAERCHQVVQNAFSFCSAHQYLKQELL